MEPINPQEPVSQDLMKQMEDIKQMPPVAPIAPTASQPAISTGMKYASFWRRFFALLIDSILVFVLNFIIITVLPIWGQSVYTADPVSLFLPISPASILSYLYLVIFIATTGQTLGKKWLGIKVVTINGGQVSWGQAISRELMRYVSSLAFLLGYLWMLWDKDKQTWHDKVAKTYVIKVK